MSMDLNQSPYFDDFDKDNKFYRVLFKPSKAVQARELTQVQSILQEQIRKFGNHMFKNGAMVIPGQITSDDTIKYVKMVSTYEGEIVDTADFLGTTIVGATSGVEATVQTVASADATDPLTFFLKIKNSGTDNEHDNFDDNEDVYRKDDTEIRAKTALTSATGESFTSSLDAGIYYISGQFIDVDSQSIVVEKYSNTPSKIIGLRIYESIVDSDDDPSLLDNAQGSPNFAAPGADRLKIELRLETVDIGDETALTNFVELSRVESGVIITEVRTTAYAELEKTMARRTFDESGDYTTKAFTVDMVEHLRDTSDTQYVDGVYEAGDTITPGDDTKLVARMGPGKAYVRGFEVTKLATSDVAFDKARDTANTQNQYTHFNNGNYVIGDAIYATPTVDKMSTVEIWWYDTGAGGSYNAGAVPSGGGAVRIGYARIRALTMDSGDMGEAGATYRIHLFDINVDHATKTFILGSATEHLVIYDSNVTNSLHFTCNVDSDANNKVQIYETSDNTMVFPLGNSVIETLSDISTTFVQLKEDVIVTGTTSASIPAGSGNIFATEIGSNYFVSNTAGVEIDVTDLTFTIGGGGTTLVITDLPDATNINVIAHTIKTGPVAAKTKTKTTDQQFTIAAPSTIVNVSNDLGHADVIQVTAIYESPDIGTAPLVSHTNVTHKYMFDDGQTDNYYGLGTIALSVGNQAPVGQLLVVYDYFAHTGDTFCSVDSYSVDYDEIPEFVSPATGQTYSLTDCIDFRPLETALIAEDVINIPMQHSDIICDYDYYLNRIDKLYVDFTGKFHMKKGISALEPSPPSSPDDGMLIADVKIPAYTFGPEQIDMTLAENKGFTMRDIGKLERRIGKVEYYVALNLLEQETANLQIQDSTGADRFKNGFIADPFTSHGVGEITHQDYKCSIDPRRGQMRPMFANEQIDLEFDEDNSSNFEQTGPLLTMQYSESLVVSQGQGSKFVNINPFAVRTFEGEIKFNPDSDNWFDTQKVGTLVVNDDAHFAALKAMARATGANQGTTWDSWQTDWQSVSSSSESTDWSTQQSWRGTNPAGNNWWWNNQGTLTQTNNFRTTRTTTDITTQQSRTGSIVTSSDKTVKKNLGDRTVGSNYIPFMRAATILVKTEGMKPDTRVYPFFDAIDVVAHTTQATKLIISGQTGTFNTAYQAEELITSSSGGTATVLFSNDSYLTVANVQGNFVAGDSITAPSGAAATFVSQTDYSQGGSLVTGTYGEIALIFSLPNTDSIRFKTGEREFVLNGYPANQSGAQTIAKGMWRSEGTTLKQQGTTLSTKTINYSSEPGSSTRFTPDPVVWSDPLAETVLIEETGGCFITQCDIFFQSKDSDLPVTCSIREVVNGYPSTVVVPYASRTLNPVNVNISSDAPTASTSFIFDAPVYLSEGTEYAIVLMSDSFNYNVWVGELGQVDLVSGNVISKQPYNGVMFKSQNASTWNAIQTEDLMFNLYKCQFNINETGTLYFRNEDLGTDILDTDAIETVSGSALIRVWQRNHGFEPAQKVTLAGLVDTIDYNGFTDNVLNASHTVVATEINSYTILMGSDATDTGTCGGSTITATRNQQIDVVRPNVEELIFPFTSLDWSLNTVSSSTNSLVGYGSILNHENTEFTESMYVGSTENELIELGAGAKSFNLLAQFNSDNRNVSPVIDINRLGCTGISNLVDNPTTESAAPTYTVATNVFTMTLADHGMMDGAMIYMTIGGSSPAIDNVLLPVRIVDADTFIVETATDAVSGTAAITRSTSHHRFVPETENSRTSSASKYMTKQINIDDPAEALKIYLSASIQSDASIDVYYKVAEPYSTDNWGDIPWTLIPEPINPVAISDGPYDVKEHEYEVGTTEGITGFTSVAVKLVMKATDSTKVPIFNDFRVICLGT